MLVGSAYGLTEPARVTVLAVTPCDNDHQTLERLFSHSGWNIEQVSTMREAIARIETGQFPVVVCERDLPDGNWKDLLQQISSRDNPPRLVVTAWHADDLLWSEVLNLGGYDVLPKPLASTEVFRVLNLAWRHWRDHLHRSTAFALPMTASAAG